jgi:hypothetical protein
MRRLLARVMVPEEGSSSPIKMRRSVVLPIPLGPTSASRAPFATEKDTLAKRSSAPKDLEREFALMRDILTLNCPPNYKARERPGLKSGRKRDYRMAAGGDPQIQCWLILFIMSIDVAGFFLPQLQGPLVGCPNGA